MKKYTDPSSLRKHVKNHSKEEQEQARAGRELDTSSGDTWLEKELQQPGVNYDYSLAAQYDSQAFRRQQEVTHMRRGEARTVSPPLESSHLNLCRYDGSPA